jgi:phosphoribosylformimino-5-aminoimidazole carboxamide ribotide isomerase
MTIEENSLKIVPVLDILNGVAVHAVRGRREEYQPLNSVLSKSHNPVDVAAVFSALGFSELYIADLDAIKGGQPNFQLFKRIAYKTGLSLMVDAGITNLKMAKKVLESKVSKIIIGTETLTSIGLVGEIVDILGSENVIISLDLVDKRILSGFELSELADPLTFLHNIEKIGISQIIILDLAKVGSGQGVDIPFVLEVLKNVKSDVFVGGGVRDITELKALKEKGIYGVLVATALHTGRILVSDVKEAGLL